LSEGSSIPIRLESDKSFYYKLFKIEPTTTSIKAVMAETAFNEIQNLKKVGKLFPDFSFKDLNSNLITNESMKGKFGHKMLVHSLCCLH
jgi:hypothetical protein